MKRLLAALNAAFQKSEYINATNSSASSLINSAVSRLQPFLSWDALQNGSLTTLPRCCDVYAGEAGSRPLHLTPKLNRHAVSHARYNAWSLGVCKAPAHYEVLQPFRCQSSMSSTKLCPPDCTPAQVCGVALEGESDTRSYDPYDEESYQHGKQSSFSKMELKHDNGALTLPTPPSSPRGFPYSEPEDGEAEEDGKDGRGNEGSVEDDDHEEVQDRGPQLRLNIELLRSDLQLAKRMCGALTQKGIHCKRGISDDNYTKISTQLSGMGRQAMPVDVLTESLENLVLLVHCYQHVLTIPKEARLDVWISFVPREPQTPKPLLWIARDIARALNMSTNCIGFTLQRKRCSKSIGGQKVHNCVRTIDQLTKPEVYHNHSFVATYLKVLEANRYCDFHSKQHRPELKEQWRLAIADAHEHQLGGQHLSMYASNIDDKRISTSRSRMGSFEASIDAATFWPEARDISPWIILESIRGPESGSRDDLIRSTACRPLDRDEQKPGWVYIYQVEGNPGLLKIGYTSRSIEERHREWSFDCNRNVLPLYPAKGHHDEKLPNAFRIEALCHAELDDCRVRVYCRNCMKEHTEWFKVSEDQALSVVRRWSSWMKTEPYQGNKLKLEETRIFGTRTMQRSSPAAIKT